MPLGEAVCKINRSGYSYSLNNFHIYNPEGFTILCRIGEASDGLNYFPDTSKLIVNSTPYINFWANCQEVVPKAKVAKDLKTTNQVAFDKSVAFLSETKITVQSVRIQRKFYQIMQTTQNVVPMTSTTKLVSIVKTKSITGF